jgi:hypothetical protein
MYQISRQTENTTERADQARIEILKLQADHAAWVQDNHNVSRVTQAQSLRIDCSSCNND